MNQIIDAPIDENRLAGIALSASADTFSQNNPKIPFSFFKSLKYRDSLENAICSDIPFTNFSRAQIAEGILPTEPDTWMMEEIIAENVENDIYKQFKKDIPMVSVCFSSANNLVTQVVKDAEALNEDGYTPILLINSWDVRELLDDKLWGMLDENTDVPFIVEKKSGFPDQYCFHINDIASYNMLNESEFCYLVALECFATLYVEEVAPGQYLKASFTPGEDRTKGTLSLGYRIKPSFSKIHSVKYTLTT